MPCCQKCRSDFKSDDWRRKYCDNCREYRGGSWRRKGYFTEYMRGYRYKHPKYRYYISGFSAKLIKNSEGNPDFEKEQEAIKKEIKRLKLEAKK